jgi:hypothetical protein
MDRIETVPGRPLKEEVIRNSLMLRTAYAIRAALRTSTGAGGPGLRLGFLGGAPRGTWTYDDAAYERFGRRGSELARHHLSMLLDLLRSRGVSMTLGAYPWPDQIIEGDHGGRHAGTLRRWAEANAVPFIDLYPTFVNGDPAQTVLERYYIRGDLHLNEAGHERMAQVILEHLRKQR